MVTANKDKIENGWGLSTALDVQKSEGQPR